MEEDLRVPSLRHRPVPCLGGSQASRAASGLVAVSSAHAVCLRLQPPELGTRLAHTLHGPPSGLHA